MRAVPIVPGDRIQVRVRLTMHPAHWGTFDHVDRGGRLVYREDGAKANLSRCGWRDVLALQAHSTAPIE